MTENVAVREAQIVFGSTNEQFANNDNCYAGVCIGFCSNIEGNGVAIGGKSFAAGNAIAIGPDVKAMEAGDIIIGDINLREEIAELRQLINEQREIINALWHHPGMPGSYEASEMFQKDMLENDRS